MHDFLLAKEIIEELKKIAKERKLSSFKRVFVEIGSITLSHDGFPDHAEDINLENLKFGLESLVKNSVLDKAEFIIRKTAGSSWKIAKIEVE